MKLAEIRQKINILRDLCEQSEDDKSIENILRELLLKNHAISAGPNGMGQRLYRIVEWDRKPKDISEVSYPPAHLVNKYGRANIKNVSMFYGASHPSTPYQELQLATGETFAYSVWKIIEPFLTFDLGHVYKTEIGLNKQLKHNKFEPMNLVTKEFFREMGEEFLKEVADGNEYQYRISATLTKVLLNNFKIDKTKIFTPNGEAVKQFGGISYPSLCSKHYRENVALLPLIVEHCLRLEEVHFAQCLGYSNDDSHISVIAIDKSFPDSNGVLNWLNLLPRQQEIMIERQIAPSENRGRWSAKGNAFNSRD
jgi:hypothetical protein